MTVINEAWLAKVLTALPGAELSTKPDWGALILGVGGKQFGRYGTDTNGLKIITVKGEPLENEALRQEFPEIVPGYYSNKMHWNSVYLDRMTFSEEQLGEMIAGSYALVFASLTKALRTEILDS